MKAKLISFLWVCLCLPVALCAEHRDLESLLKELDAVIDRKDTYTLPKENELSELRMRLKGTKDNRQKYDLCNRLFVGYLHYHNSDILLQQCGFDLVGEPFVCNKSIDRLDGRVVDDRCFARF